MTDPKAVKRMRDELVVNGLLAPIYADLYAESLLKFFGTTPTRNQLHYWMWNYFRCTNTSATESQSVGIVAWDGDE